MTDKKQKFLGKVRKISREEAEKMFPPKTVDADLRKVMSLTEGKVFLHPINLAP